MDLLITIAIDGHSSCGKSTLAKEMAKALGSLYIDSGAMYRAVALKCLRTDTDPSDSEAMDALLAALDISISYPDGRFRIALDGEDITERIIQGDVSDIVSEVAAISSVRKKLVEIQKSLGAQKAVVMDGRDIGTVVFPQAELKLFITAALEVRAQRRFLELKEKGIPLSLDAVSQNLVHRDNIDSTRADSPLRQATDAIRIDNSYMSREEQLFLALKLAHEARAKLS